MLENIKKYWFLIALLGGAAVWIATIDSKTFDSPEQKVKHVIHVNESLTPEQQLRAYIMDSLNKDSAIKTRAERLRNEIKRDSIRAINDSIANDKIDRSAVQMQQTKEVVENLIKQIKNKN